VDEIELVVVNYGSTDRAAKVAREAGVRHIVRFRDRKGLAQAFMAALDTSLRVGGMVD